MRVVCDNCKRYLFTTDKKNGGSIGFEAQCKGFIYKNACLFSKEYSSLYFCSGDCKKKFYDKHIKPNPEVSKALEELKKDIPSMTTDVCSKMDKLVSDLKSKGLLK